MRGNSKGSEKPTDLPSSPGGCSGISMREKVRARNQAERKPVTKLGESEEDPRQLLLMKLKGPKMSLKVD